MLTSALRAYQNIYASRALVCGRDGFIKLMKGKASEGHGEFILRPLALKLEKA
jgi:hypothetical protein